MKIGIAVAGAVIVLLGVVAMVTMRSDGSTNRATTVASQASEPGTAPVVTTVTPKAPATQPAPTTKAPTAPATTAVPAKAPATATATTPVSAPTSVQDVQQLIAGMTAQLQASAAANGTNTPMTKEQVEAQVRAQLAQLGITF
jgi:predicted lipid-binding transport protein (Tim44 family)